MTGNSKKSLLFLFRLPRLQLQQHMLVKIKTSIKICSCSRFAWAACNTFEPSEFIEPLKSFNLTFNVRRRFILPFLIFVFHAIFI